MTRYKDGGHSFPKACILFDLEVMLWKIYVHAVTHNTKKIKKCYLAVCVYITCHDLFICSVQNAFLEAVHKLMSYILQIRHNKILSFNIDFFFCNFSMVFNNYFNFAAKIEF